jgi:hypothetical protein
MTTSISHIRQILLAQPTTGKAERHGTHLVFEKITTIRRRTSGQLLGRSGFTGVFLAETLDPARGVDELLLSGKEGMTVRTDFE